MFSLVTFLFVTLFVLSLSVLLFELSLTRIFSIILWYNYAFMAISIAFFGLGIGALVVHILKNKIQEKDLPSKILQSVIAFAISIPVFLFIIGHIIPPNVSFIYLFYLASSIPFFFAGTSMALVYLTMPREITRLYFVDLVGAAIAAIVLDPLIGEVGAENVLLLTGLLAIGSALLCTVISIGKKNVLSVTIESKIKYYAVIVVATSALLFITNTTGFNLLLIPPGESKGLHNVLANPSYEHLLTQWNSFSRIDVIRNNQDPSTVGSILIDADALTPIHRWNNASTSTKTVTLKGNETIWSNTIPLNNTNYIESTFRVTDEYKNNQNHSGIVWNDGNNKEYYAFLRSNRLSVYTPDQGEFQSAPLIENREIGKWFTLKVVYVNGEINIFLNNTHKLQIPNTSKDFDISKVGIRSFNSIAQFKPIKIGTVSDYQQLHPEYPISVASSKTLDFNNENYVALDPYGDIQWVKKYMDYLPYEISKTNSTLVIGSGGGDDVLIALAGGSKDVTAVEINPLVVSAVKQFSGNSVGNLYDRKDVRLFIDDGRRFISSTNAKYDKIVLRLVDSWAAQLAGGYALSENYLYTVEGFRQYLHHLSGDNGMLVMVRWNTELPRLIPLVIESLHQEETKKSINDISKQILIVENRPDMMVNDGKEQSIYTVLVIVKSSPFSSSELDLVKKRIAMADAKVIAMPGEYVQPPYDSLLQNEGRENIKGKPSQVGYTTEKTSFFGMKPPTDDSPFYFAKEQVPYQMKLLLITVVGASAVLALLLIYYSKINKIKLTTSSTSLHISFVIFIGLGFIFLEIAFIQKFLLLLGTPIMALTVILFTILLSSGIGSYLSGRLFSKNAYKAVVISIPLLAGLISIYYVYLSSIIYSGIVLDVYQRIMVTFVLLFPAGFLMGFQFPSITRMASSLLHSSDLHSVRNDITLLWGVNVIASVIGTVLAAISSMTIGFNGNLLIAVGLYLGALASAIIAVKTRQHMQGRKAIAE
jgi:hypothetical protein